MIIIYRQIPLLFRLGGRFSNNHLIFNRLIAGFSHGEIGDFRIILRFSVITNFRIFAFRIKRPQT